MPTKKPRILAAFEPDIHDALRRFAGDYELSMSSLLAAIVEPIARELIEQYEHIDTEQPELIRATHGASIPDALLQLYRSEPYWDTSDAARDLEEVFDHLRDLARRGRSWEPEIVLPSVEHRSEAGAAAPPAARSAGEGEARLPRGFHPRLVTRG